MSLKDFEITKKLGQGAYSSVYKVKRHKDGEVYALKKVKMNNLSEKQQQNALNEVRILASISSPYIVGYKHAFIQGKSLCIVMDFLDDGDLYQKIVENQKYRTGFDQGSIWKTLIQIVSGLKNLHDLNILHRDLKSANVFLSKDGTAKLGDMNVSKIAKNGLLYTQTGTPYYASPEVWKDKPYDSKSDIWSLGCVIYEMATLKPPFRAEDMQGLYKKVTKGAYQKIPTHFSKALGEVIKSMLELNPSNRPSASQLLKNLRSKAQQYDIELNDTDELNKELLKTIRTNKNLHYLTDRLPKSKYKTDEESRPRSRSIVRYCPPTKVKSPTQHGPTKGILPTIEGRKGYKNPENRKYPPPRNRDLIEILRIQGQRKNPKYQYQQEQSAKILERDLKVELRKISNNKASPSKNRLLAKPMRRNISIPSIN